MDIEYKVLFCAYWILDTDIGYWTIDIGYGMINIGRMILDKRYSTLDKICLIIDIGHIGYGILKTVYGIFNNGH